MGVLGVLGEMLSLRDKNETDRSHLEQAVLSLRDRMGRGEGKLKLAHRTTLTDRTSALMWEKIGGASGRGRGKVGAGAINAPL